MKHAICRKMARPASIAAACIVLLALLLRIYLALHCEAKPDYSDMKLYNDVALAPGWPTQVTPAYPLFLRAVYSIFGALNYKAVFVVQSILSTLTVYLFYRIGSKVGTTATGILAAAIAAIYPVFIFYNFTTLTETWSLLILMVLLHVLLDSIPEIRKSVLSVLTITLGFLFRPVMLFFLPGAWICVRKKRAFAFATAATIVPLLIYETTVGETFFRGAKAFYKAYHDPGSWSQGMYNASKSELKNDKLQGESYLKAGWDFIKKNRMGVIEDIYEKAAILVSRGFDTFVLQPIVGRGRLLSIIMNYVYLPLALLGLIGLARRYDSKNRCIALCALSYFLLVIIFSIFKIRYRLLIEPALIIYASLLLFPPKRNRIAEAQRCSKYPM